MLLLTNKSICNDLWRAIDQVQQQCDMSWANCRRERSIYCTQEDHETISFESFILKKYLHGSITSKTGYRNTRLSVKPTRKS